MNNVQGDGGRIGESDSTVYFTLHSAGFIYVYGFKWVHQHVFLLKTWCILGSNKFFFPSWHHCFGGLVSLTIWTDLSSKVCFWQKMRVDRGWCRQRRCPWCCIPPLPGRQLGETRDKRSVCGSWLSLDKLNRETRLRLFFHQENWIFTPGTTSIFSHFFLYKILFYFHVGKHMWRKTCVR